MKRYRGTVQADRWPEEFTVEANSWPAALAKMGRAWHKKNKGSRTTQLSVKLFRANGMQNGGGT